MNSEKITHMVCATKNKQHRKLQNIRKMKLNFWHLKFESLTCCKIEWVSKLLFWFNQPFGGDREADGFYHFFGRGGVGV